MEERVFRDPLFFVFPIVSVAVRILDSY